MGDWSVDVDCVEFKALASYTLLLLQVTSYIILAIRHRKMLPADRLSTQ